MVFGNCGVLLEITPNKGYVEMTGVDADTSHDIAEVNQGFQHTVFHTTDLLLLQAIQAKGGRFLEAQIQGSKNQAEEGSLVILAAGDRSLFDECQTCFQAMGRNSFYFGNFNLRTLLFVLPWLKNWLLVYTAQSKKKTWITFTHLSATLSLHC